MAQQTISLGTVANDGTGDPIRTAFTKVNTNFTEVYAALGSLQNADNDLTAIALLSGTSGFLKKSTTDTWVLDNSTYLTSINSTQVVTALGYTPYNGSTNTSGFLTGITSAQVVTALGYTPYNATNPSGYLSSITSSQVTTALGFTPIQSNSLSVTTAAASGGGSLSYSGGVFTFTPASVPTLGTGVAAFLLNPTSATLAAALSDESGTNTVAFTNSPTFITPTLGNASATSLAINGGTLSINNLSGVSAATWGLTGIGISAPGATYTDTTSTGTVATVEAIHSLNNPILASTLATTFTSATTLYLGIPSAGANVTITNAYSLYAAGGVLVGGTLTCNSTIALSGTSSGSCSLGTSITSGSISIGTGLSTGLVTIGGTSSTGTMTFGQSTGAQTYNIGTGATLAATTKAINIGTAGVSTSITNITIGSAVSGSTTNLTLNGTLAAASAITTAQSVGYIGYPQNSTAVGITLALTDIGKHVYVSATGQTITIPANATVAFPIGTEITIVGGSGATSTSIAITTDTLNLSPAGTTGTRTLAAFGIAKLLKVAATTWYISGTGLT